MKQILLIDDDTFICEILKKYLVKNNYIVHTAFSGKSASDLLKKHHFDLVLCDFRLPDTSGLELLKKIKAQKSSTPVIIITAYADVKVAVQLMKMGATDYITKPIQQEELLNLIEKLFSQPTPVQTGNSNNASDNDFIVGESPQIKQVITQANRVAPTNMSVIIEGETGTGKEYIARYIHQNSERSNKPFVAIDCGAIPKELANSELFGHIKGSFTGAINDKEGVFQRAHGGTLFLDEIGNLSYDIQLKLLRVIQERVVSKVGDKKAQNIDIRIITATNENLKSELQENKFREDLFHRLNEFNIKLPALRNRKQDILLFASHFLKKANIDLNTRVSGFSPDVEEIIVKYPWCGNLRELKNVVKRAVLMSNGHTIEKEVLPHEIVYPEPSATNSSGTAEVESSSILKNASYEIEKQLIIKTIQEAGYNKSKAAEMLNINRKTLYNKIKLYDIDM
ncbi:two-component system, NtrC family, response regulator HydG [Saccharicrinis carchari]|uniref:Two-component system, NtrC family, response regulator HydG n=1 Tax=Saccharicrinis carchari TaxID=1168039 RepID=A0A521CFL3_SACCC|nr:sigma-54 dependent transcriptional regulator [Saccharicrinis carchari]SMO58227.1 two-component system, NtrC family, response regulator HydG [Saccharicrinis carchari]